MQHRIHKTNYPKKFIIPKDKVSNKLFNGEMLVGTTLVATENKKSNKKLTAKVNIDFEELENLEISLCLSSNDRDVHDAIVSLYVDGNNEYINPLMIYRTITGNPKAKITPNHYNNICNSVIRCSMTRIRIDAENEAKAFRLDKLVYEGNLLYTKKVKGTLKNEVSDWIYVMERPILFDYANSKGQIDRVDIQLLNTPVSKNEETIKLQGYLLRRIRTMKKSKMSRNILFETVYKQLDIKSASPGALRKKQCKIRETVTRILDYWIELDEIKGYKENRGQNNSIISLTIYVD